MGGLTHCFNRFMCRLTHCLINLFPSVLGGYTSFLCAGGNSQSENGGIFEVLFLALMMNYLFNKQVIILSEKGGLFGNCLCFNDS